MKNVVIYSILVALFSGKLISQEYTSITLEEVLVKVQDQNAKIEMSNLEVVAAKADYGMSGAFFLPDVSVSHTGFTTTNPLMAFGSKLNQEVLTQADFNPQILNDPDNVENFATIISVQQPLINLDGFYCICHL